MIINAHSRRRGRPSRLSVGISDKKPQVLKEQLGDLKIDKSRSVGHSDNIVVVNSEDSLAGGQNKPDVNAELRNSEKNATNSTDSVIALEQISCKSTSGELKSSSSPRLELSLNVSDTEPKLGRKRARKSAISSSEKVNKDGPVKRSAYYLIHLMF